jgi:hypothetical protein
VLQATATKVAVAGGRSQGLSNRPPTAIVDTTGYVIKLNRKTWTGQLKKIHSKLIVKTNLEFVMKVVISVRSILTPS